MIRLIMPHLIALAILGFIIGTVLSMLRPDHALVFLASLCAGGLLAMLRRGWLGIDREAMPVRVTRSRQG